VEENKQRLWGAKETAGDTVCEAVLFTMNDPAESSDVGIHACVKQFKGRVTR
jgi:hypothetical protein